MCHGLSLSFTVGYQEKRSEPAHQIRRPRHLLSGHHFLVLSLVPFSLFCEYCRSFPLFSETAIQAKKPLPPDVYRPSAAPLSDVKASEKKSVLKSDNNAGRRRSSGERTVRINESGERHETLAEKRVRAASPAKPANIHVKLLQSYEAVDGEELSVRKGQRVKLLYRQNDWAYVVNSSGREGFVPYWFCSTPKYSSTDSKSSTSGHEDSFDDENADYQSRRSRRTPNGVCRTPNGVPRNESRPRLPNHTATGKAPRERTHKPSTMTYFPKRSYGPHLTVLYDYKAQQENDVSVVRGECVMLLNDQDPDWLWIVVEDGEEGFVPRAFLTSHACEGEYQYSS